MPRFSTTIASIPCQVEVRYLPPSRGARESGSGVQLEPDEPESYEFVQAFDRRGYPAPWLEKKLTDEEISRIEQDALEYFHSLKN